MDDDRLRWHLANWQAWMHHHNLRLGYPTKAVGMHSQASRDFDEMVETADARCAAAVDAIIDGLNARSRAAIYRAHLGSSWRYLFDFAAAYAIACNEVRTGLLAKGIE